MKNLFLSLVFVFATAFSFAGSSNLVGGGDLTCVTVTTSCSIVGTVCDYTTEGLVAGAAELDEWACGPQQ